MQELAKEACRPEAYWLAAQNLAGERGLHKQIHRY